MILAFLDDFNETMQKPTILWSMQDRSNFALVVLGIVFVLVAILGVIWMLGKVVNRVRTGKW